MATAKVSKIDKYAYNVFTDDRYVVFADPDPNTWWILVAGNSKSAARANLRNRADAEKWASSRKARGPFRTAQAAIKALEG